MKRDATPSVSLRALPANSPNKLVITIILVLATTMQALDMTIVNVSLPHMEASLNATQDQISWVLTSYIVASAIATPATGWMSARFGRTRLFVISMAGFTVVSLFCGIAQTLPQMVLFRILQGVFAASLMPLSQAIMLDTHTREEMGRAMAIWGMGVMVGPIIGPTLGGFLTDQYNWRWCFYINLPIGVAAVIAALAFIPETTRIQDRKFDWFGFAFLSLALASLQLALDRGEQKEWFASPEIQIETALFVFGIYMFVVHSMTTKRPFLDPVMFKDRAFVLSLLIAIMIGVVFNGSMVLTPQLLQTELNYPVVTAGLVMGPRGFGTIAAMMLYGRLSNRLDARPLVVIGLVVISLSMYVMSGWSLMVGAREIVTWGIVQGFGMGLVFGPMTALAFSSLPTYVRTEASGFYALMRNMGASVGISIVVSQLTEFTQSNHAYLGAYMTPFRHMPPTPGMTGQAAMEMLNFSLTQQAGMVAYVNVFRLMALLSIVFAPVLIFMRSTRPQDRPKAEDAAALAH
ncbi:MAG TPA: MDR family MFS transporter [Alphaproteobacteria bacterium]|nr:MDR family MFS transporter [Alphaproteobacteria bacterium]